MTDSQQPFPPPGWHPDPSGEPGLRYWDGARWTEHRASGQPNIRETPPPSGRRSSLSRILGRKGDAERAAQAHYEALLSEVVHGVAELATASSRLQATAEAAALSTKQVHQYQQRAFSAVAERMLADDCLTTAEEQELMTVARVLGITQEQLDHSFEHLRQRLLVAQINDGRLPVVATPRLLVKRDEKVHAELPAQLMKEVVHREYRGGSSGVSVPIGLGIRFHTSGSRGRSVVTGTSLAAADSGVLSISTTRVVFQGMKKNQESRLDKLTGIDVFNDGIRVGVSNRQTASLYRVSDGLVAGALITVLAQRWLDA
jgi:hypothetical protein